MSQKMLFTHSEFMQRIIHGPQVAVGPLDKKGLAKGYFPAKPLPAPLWREAHNRVLAAWACLTGRAVAVLWEEDFQRLARRTVADSKDILRGLE